MEINDMIILDNNETFLINKKKYINKSLYFLCTQITDKDKSKFVVLKKLCKNGDIYLKVVNDKKILDKFI